MRLTLVSVVEPEVASTVVGFTRWLRLVCDLKKKACKLFDQPLGLFLDKVAAFGCSRFHSILDDLEH